MRSLRFGTGFLGAFVVFTVALARSPAGALAISVPASKNLGTVATGASSVSAQLGPVTATDTGVLSPPSFVAQVTSSTFTTGTKTSAETIQKTSIRYWSGPATVSSGLAASSAPGQPTAASAQDLSTSRTAFTATGLLLSVSVTWNPTLIITIPASAVAGVYTGTITHSVA
ncbi:MAG TPA: hypothetical protein VHM89_03110 [Acidimicrobiales bacterium]|nr:hypothetical protein [Acidimicrobiales bacterium]